jgi:hypothetical protein
MNEIGAVALNAMPRVVIVSNDWMIPRDIFKVHSLALEIATWV